MFYVALKRNTRILELFTMKFNFYIELLLIHYKIIFTICAEVSCIVLVIIGSLPFDVAILVFCKGIVTSPIITCLN